MKRLFYNLTDPIDNSPLILFRIFFGALMFFESVGAIVLGWVKETFVEPKFTFNFIGFDFLQHIIVGPQAYLIYILMAICGLGIMLGYRYKLSIITFFVLWCITYLGQKSHYNNHYYLLMLISGMMIFVPAHKYKSLDVKQKRTEESLVAPKWTVNIFIWQIMIVYFYASIAKIYPDWLKGIPIEIWYNAISFETPFWSNDFAVQLKHFFTTKPIILFFAYAGILFDLLVAPMFLWNRWTRTIALIASLVFHLTNSAIFQIGVFPYFALAFIVFFYKPEFIRKIFFKNKTSVENTLKSYSKFNWHPFLKSSILCYFILQLVLPLRHHLIPSKVLWTEEGHRLSWRMMLRTKSSYTTFKVVDKDTGIKKRVPLLDYVTRNQYGDLMSKPDLMWQFAQHLKKEYKKDGKDIEVYVNAKCGVNGRPKSKLTIDTINIADEPWRTFGHQRWLTDAPF